MLCLGVCICTRCMPSAQVGQERAWAALELEFWMVMNHVDSNLRKSNKYSKMLSHLFCSA